MLASSDARLKVLIVDDESAIVTELGSYLERRGVEVLYGDSGETALAFLGRKDSGTLTHLVVDLRMPVMDGFELISQIDRESFPDLTIVAVSGHAAYEDEMRVRGLGANHFLLKPYKLKDLLAIIRGPDAD